MKARETYYEQTFMSGTARRNPIKLLRNDDPTDDLDLLWLALSRKVHSVVYHEVAPLADQGRMQRKPGSGPFFI